MTVLRDVAAMRAAMSGLQLLAAFKTTKSVEDLYGAIKILDKAVDSMSDGHPLRPVLMTWLGGCYGLQFEVTDRKVDIDRAIQLIRTALEIHIENPVDVDNLSSSFGFLETWLSIRFKRRGSATTDDLHEAVDAAEMAVQLTEQEDPDWGGRMNNLGNRLLERFNHAGSGKDLDKAIECSKLSGNPFIPPSSMEQAMKLSNLGLQLSTRFEETGEIEDLNRAIENMESALKLTSLDATNERCAVLNNLGNLLGARYEHTGVIKFLHRAIEFSTTAVDKSPRSNPDRIDFVGNLGVWLSTRAEAIGVMEDIQQSIRLIKEVLNDSSAPQHSRPRLLLALGSSLRRRYEKTDCICDLHEAIRLTRESVESVFRSNVQRAGSLNYLAQLLAIRAGVRESPGCRHTPRCAEAKGATPEKDLEEATEKITRSLSLTAASHTSRPHLLGNLAAFLYSKFQRSGGKDISVIDEVIRITQEALDTTGQESPDKADILFNLGRAFLARHRITNSLEDQSEALGRFQKGWDCQNATASLRIRLAQMAAQIHTSRYDWESAHKLQEQAVKLFPSLSPRYLPNTDKQNMLGEFSGFASVFASVALNAGKKAYDALRLLELGRGIISSLALEMRGDLSELEAGHPGLAMEFIRLRDELDSQWNNQTTSSDNVTMRESLARKRREAETGFNQLLQTIQAKPGFNDFCSAPSESEMISAAGSGPLVVINVSSLRCDAFMIQTNGISLVELPHLNMDTIKEQVNRLWNGPSATSSDMVRLLEWLWTSTMCPCLDALGFKESISDDIRNWPHVWWIPTGLLSQLPLHAAGLYKDPSTETVLDRVMSSYAISVKTLMHGRRRQHPIQKSPDPSTDEAVLVAMPTTPGLLHGATLAWAQEEVDTVDKLCCSLALKSTMPKARKDEVLKCLKGCRIFHFAGHGQSDPVEPSQSRLLLEDWQTNALTVDDLRSHRLQESQPFLAYLSACSTGANQKALLCDEGVHLASSLQLAGFQHVVGTLWEVSDQHCVDVARAFYETLRERGLTDEGVPRGLHVAVKVLRDGQLKPNTEDRKGFCIDHGARSGGKVDFHWVPYMHFGV